MDKFEYITKIEYKRINNPHWLNKIGSEGWELVSVIETRDIDNTELLRYYFKRKLCDK
jgi:hypothetical protein